MIDVPLNINADCRKRLLLLDCVVETVDFVVMGDWVVIVVVLLVDGLGVVVVVVVLVEVVVVCVLFCSSLGFVGLGTVEVDA